MSNLVNLNRLPACLFLSVFLLVSQMSLAQPAKLSPLQQAQQAQKLGHYEEAERLWQQVLRQHPNSAEAYYNLGVSLHRQFKLPEAIAAYEQATRLNPHDGASYINLGLASIQVNKVDQAIQSFQAVIALPNQPADPANTHTLAHYNLAIIFKRQGKLPEARQEVEQALALTPTFALAQQLVEELR